MKRTLVMKFGGAAVATIDSISMIADLIIERKKEFPRLVVVVSAMGETTNQLIKLAEQVHPNPPQREYDMLISTGERISMSLLAMTLCKRNCEAISFTGSQSGIITTKHHTNAKIIDVRPHRIASSLDMNKIAIVAGFQGVSKEGSEITTLGRGGSDTTAAALAIALSSSNSDEFPKVEFYKDVPGIFNLDPKIAIHAEQHHELNYEEALEIVRKGAKILHERALLLGQKNKLELHVKSFLNEQKENPGTIIRVSQTMDPAKDSIKHLPIYEHDMI